MEHGMPTLALVAIGACLLIASPWACSALLFGVAPVFNPSVRIGLVRLYVNNLSVCLLLAAVVFRAIRQRELTIYWTKGDRAMAFLGFAFLLSAMNTGGGSDTIKKLMALALLFLGYGVAKLLAKDEASFVFTCKWMAASAAFAGAAGLYTFFFVPFRGTVARATGAFGNPNGLANYLLLTIPFTFFAYEVAQKNWHKILCGLGMIVAILGALRTASKGGMAGALAWPLVAGTVIGKRTTFFIVLLGAILFLGHLHLAVMSDEGSTILDLASFVARSPEVVQRDRFHLWVIPGVPVEYDTLSWSDIDEDKDIPKSFRARTILWGQGIEAFLSSPILGIGLGKARFSAIPYDSKTFDGAFNIWITLLAETGLIGCLAFLNVIWWFMRRAVNLWRKSTNQTGRVLAAALLAALAGYMLHCLVEDVVFAVMTNWLFGMVLGLISIAPKVVSSYRTVIDEEEEE